jgi:hypothetical protein
MIHKVVAGMPKRKTPQTAQRYTTTLGDAYAAFIVSRAAQNVPPRTDPAYGDRWFCIEAEAQATGWRKAYRQAREGAKKDSVKPRHFP